MRTLNWVFLLLYELILFGLFGYAYSNDLPDWLSFPFYIMHEKIFWTVFVLIITIISQIIFVFGAGKIDLQRPKNKFIILVPIAVAAIAFAFLSYAFIGSIVEFFDMSVSPVLTGNTALWIIFLILWIIWGAIFFILLKNTTKYEMLKKLILALIAGSLMELLPAALIHLVTSKRGCFGGLFTSAAISLGLVVMLWSFGPGIIFLFMREKNKAEEIKKPGKAE